MINPSVQAARRLASSLAAAILAAAPSIAAASEFDRFTARAEAGPTISHEAFDLFLERIAVKEGGRLRVAYSAAGEDGASFLSAYAERLAQISPAQLSEGEQLAYWLNLRNALILAEFSRRGGRGDLKKLRGDFAAPGEAWTQKRIAVDGVELSIDDIERRIILLHYNDPRVLYGLYQGSESGPRLAMKAFEGESVLASLDALGRDFVSNEVRARKGALELPAVYSWYKDAVFSGGDDAVKAHILSLATAAAREKLGALPAVTYAKFRYQIEKFEVRTAPPVAIGPGQGTSSFPTGS